MRSSQASDPLALLEPQAQPQPQELQRLQQRLVHLEQAQAELEAFTAAVAHDLRTPLSAVDGFCSLLDDSLSALAQPEAAQARHYASRIRHGIEHMGELVEALLALSQASSAGLVCEPVDLSALALEVLDGLHARQPQQPHQVSVQPGLTAWGDRRLLRQLFENLLGNAWKFSSRLPVIRIEFGQQPAHEGAAFYVRDSGAGFDMAEAERLFQPFERLHPTQEFEGTGMGLATVRRIVHRHGGQVRAESAPGQGATFYFTLGEPEPAMPAARGAFHP